MKKMFFAVAALVAMSFVACGNNTQAEGGNDTDSVAVDTTVVDSVVVDTFAVDTVAVDTVVAE
jgi:hypothetical protein